MGWPGPVTRRQFSVLRAWIKLQWNVPSRTDHYLMKIAQRAHQGWVKEPNQITEDMQRVRFLPTRAEGDVRNGLTVEQATAYAKAKWQRTTGGKSVVTPRPMDEA